MEETHRAEPKKPVDLLEQESLTRFDRNRKNKNGGDGNNNGNGNGNNGGNRNKKRKKSPNNRLQGGEQSAAPQQQEQPNAMLASLREKKIIR